MTEFEKIKDDTWFKVLKPEEKVIVLRYFNTPEDEWYDEVMYREGHWVIEQFHLIHELMPFSGDRISIRSWIQDARNKGLVNAREMYHLIDFCIYNLRF